MTCCREKSVQTLVLPRRPAPGQVLLGLNTGGTHIGRYDGFRSSLRPGLTLEENAVRSLWEGAGMETAPSAMIWCGVLTYIYDSQAEGVEINVFTVGSWNGEPWEAGSVRPVWFDDEAVPLETMCASAKSWLEPFLLGHLSAPFCGRFHFKAREGPEAHILLDLSVTSFTPLHCGTRDPLATGAALIASTVSFRRAPEGCARPLESFVRYHLRKGFACIMLFVDDASDSAAIEAALKFPSTRVVIKVRGAELLSEQLAKCASFSKLSAIMDTDVSARQVLDAELAMACAPDLGCAWVVCLDSDELFYTDSETVVSHFESLASQGIDQMTYLNHEGVPEVAETADYFATVTLFRRHHFSVPLNGPARDGLRFWMDRSRRGQYMLFYDNGKSACRSGLSAKPRSQHLWELPSGCRSCTALADPRRMDVEGYRNCLDPCILHFPICGLSWFLAKYETLGNFPGTWLGKVRLPESFHTDARDLCTAGGEGLRAKFGNEVLLDDPEEVERQILCGTCLRIYGHVHLLDSIRNLVVADSKAPKKPTARLAQPAPHPCGPQGIERGWILSKTLGYL